MSHCENMADNAESESTDNEHLTCIVSGAVKDYLGICVTYLS